MRTKIEISVSQFFPFVKTLRKKSALKGENRDAVAAPKAEPMKTTRKEMERGRKKGRAAAVKPDEEPKISEQNT